MLELGTQHIDPPFQDVKNIISIVPIILDIIESMAEPITHHCGRNRPKWYNDRASDEMDEGQSPWIGRNDFVVIWPWIRSREARGAKNRLDERQEVDCDLRIPIRRLLHSHLMIPALLFVEDTKIDQNPLHKIMLEMMRWLVHAVGSSIMLTKLEDIVSHIVTKNHGHIAAHNLGGSHLVDPLAIRNTVDSLYASVHKPRSMILEEVVSIDSPSQIPSIFVTPLRRSIHMAVEGAQLNPNSVESHVGRLVRDTTSDE